MTDSVERQHFINIDPYSGAIVNRTYNLNLPSFEEDGPGEFFLKYTLPPGQRVVALTEHHVTVYGPTAIAGNAGELVTNGLPFEVQDFYVWLCQWRPGDTINNKGVRDFAEQVYISPEDSERPVSYSVATRGAFMRYVAGVGYAYLGY